MAIDYVTQIGMRRSEKELELYLRMACWGIAFFGAIVALAEDGKEWEGITTHFDTERVLNPVTKPVLLRQS